MDAPSVHQQVKGHWIAAFAVVIAALVAPSSVPRSGHGRADRVPGLGRQAPHRHSQIFTVQPGGTHVRQLTRFHDSGAALPDWSPDGRKIIFTRYWGELGPPESFQLLTMNADGSAMRAVTSRARRTSPVPPRRPSSTTGAARAGSSPIRRYAHSRHSDSRALGLVVRSRERRNRIALTRHLKVNETLRALFVGRLFGGRAG